MVMSVGVVYVGINRVYVDTNEVSVDINATKKSKVKKKKVKTKIITPSNPPGGGACAPRRGEWRFF